MKISIHFKKESPSWKQAKGGLYSFQCKAVNVIPLKELTVTITIPNRYLNEDIKGIMENYSPNPLKEGETTLIIPFDLIQGIYTKD